MKKTHYVKCKYLKFLILLTITLTNCGYELCQYKNSYINYETQCIIFDNLNDYDSLLIETIKYELFSKNILFLEKKNQLNIKIPVIHITNMYQNFNNLPIIKHGTFTPIKLILQININIDIPNIKIIPVNITIHKSLLNDNSTPLEREIKINLLRKEMYQNAAQQIINNIIFFTTEFM